MEAQIKQVVQEFRSIPQEKAKVHLSSNLGVLADLLMEKGLLFPVKRRRQGKRGRNSARNFMLRKALWFARSYQYASKKEEKKK